MRHLVIGIVAVFMVAQVVYGISSVTKPYTFVSGTKAEAAKVNANDDALVTGVNAAIGALNQAAGTKATLDARLDIALNEDGTFKNISGVTAGSQWLNPAFAFNYSSATKFNVAGNQTDIYLTYRRLKANLAATTGYSEVVSSAYNAGTNKTYITIADAVLTSPITSIEHSIITPVSSSNSAVSARVSTGYPLASASTASSIVLRDASGNFSAGTITAALTGTASNSSALNSQAASFYQNADNLNAGTVALARIPSTLTGKDADTVDGFHASQTPGANQIPVLGADKTLQIPGPMQVYYGSGDNIPLSFGVNQSNGDAWFGWNANQATGDTQTYKVNGGAFKVRFDTSNAIWQIYNASSGTAGTAITWNGPYNVMDTGHDGAGTTFDADLLDGQHGAYYQPASTAITTSNIGSQSVLDSDKLDGKHWVNIVDSSVQLNSNTVADINLRASGSHRYYRYSVYPTAASAIEGYEVASNLSFSVVRPNSGAYDYLHISNRTAFTYTLNYKVDVWE